MKKVKTSQEALEATFAEIRSAERIACAKLICKLCASGLRYNYDTQAHGKLYKQECAASAIWEREREEAAATQTTGNPVKSL